MIKSEVALHKTYEAKVSGKFTAVRLDSESIYGGWLATNTQTGRRVRIKTAARLRREVIPMDRPTAIKLANEAMGEDLCPWCAQARRDEAAGNRITPCLYHPKLVDVSQLHVYDRIAHFLGCTRNEAERDCEALHEIGLNVQTYADAEKVAAITQTLGSLRVQETRELFADEKGTELQ